MVRARGFTIVELLIVVVVIAILAAITIVSYNGITESARVSAAKSFASQLKHRDLGQAQGFWSFDECSGGSVTNSAGAALGGTTVSGAAAWSTDTPSGSGCSFSFNGSTFLNTGVTLTNDYYMKSAWIKASTASTSQNIMSDIGTNSNSAFYLAASDANKLSAGHNGSWGYVKSTASLNDAKWHFVSVEYKRNGTAANGTMTLTVDGSVVSTNTSAAEMGAVTTSIQTIGAYNSSSYFSGLMDDVMVIVR